MHALRVCQVEETPPVKLRALDAVTPEVDVLVWNGDLCNHWKDPAWFTTTILSPAGLAAADRGVPPWTARRRWPGGRCRLRGGRDVD
jgi:hypothetical protein